MGMQWWGKVIDLSSDEVLVLHRSDPSCTTGQQEDCISWGAQVLPLYSST